MGPTDGPTDGRTDQPTNRPTDTVTYRSRARDKNILIHDINASISYCVNPLCLSNAENWSYPISQIGISCVIYPNGWSSSEVRHVCGPEAREFFPGHQCQIWWAFYAAVAGGISNLFAALLTLFYEVREREREGERGWGRQGIWKIIAARIWTKLVVSVAKGEIKHEPKFQLK